MRAGSSEQGAGSGEPQAHPYAEAARRFGERAQAWVLREFEAILRGEAPSREYPDGITQDSWGPETVADASRFAKEVVSVPPGSTRPENAQPCPFCGSTWILIGQRWSAICVDCGATGPDKETSGKAGSAWNRRAPVKPEVSISCDSAKFQEAVKEAGRKLSSLLIVPSGDVAQDGGGAA